MTTGANAEEFLEKLGKATDAESLDEILVQITTCYSSEDVSNSVEHAPLFDKLKSIPESLANNAKIRRRLKRTLFMFEQKVKTSKNDNNSMVFDSETKKYISSSENTADRSINNETQKMTFSLPEAIRAFEFVKSQAAPEPQKIAVSLQMVNMETN